MLTGALHRLSLRRLVGCAVLLLVSHSNLFALTAEEFAIRNRLLL